VDDRQTTIHDLKERIRRFCSERDWDQYHNAKDLAIGVATEAAELLEHFRFRSPEECDALLGEPERRRAIAHELADVLYFALRLAQRYDIDLAAASEEKLRLNAAKYPVDLARGRNAKYTEL
jgi:NTP pyrophosphatase (non-canonical NTP hydrolase)